MNILVCVKRVPLTGGKIVLTDDERAIQTRHLGFTVSPHEECGAEEAVRLIEQHGGLSDGADARAARGRGAAARPDGDRRRQRDPPRDRRRRVGSRRRPRAAIVDAIRQQPEPPDLILFGNESADAGNYQVAIRVAHALGCRASPGVKAIAVDGSARSAASRRCPAAATSTRSRCRRW